MNEALTVYTLPSCVQCTSTKRALEDAGLPYEVVDLSTDEAAVKLVKRLGHAQAPVVTVGEASWSGFRPDLIATVAAARATEPVAQEVAACR